jgi:MFS family permease
VTRGDATAATALRAPGGFNVVNFCLADVAGGLGPFLPTWLAVALHWSPERIGWAMTFGGVTGLICNLPAGALVDRLGRPRRMIAAGSALILAGTLVMVTGRFGWGGALGWVLVGLGLTGLGGAVIGPSIAAASLAYVGPRRFPAQQGRNAAWSNAGNVCAAGVVLAAARATGAWAAPAVLGAMAMATLGALAVLRGPAGAAKRLGLHAGAAPTRLVRLFRRPGLARFALCLLCFHLGNAAMLPLLGLRLARGGGGQATQWMSACVIVSQLAMVGVAIGAGRLAQRYGERPLLLAACVVLPLRGILAAFGQAPGWLIPIELMDAFGAGTLGVITPPLVAGLTWGSGRTQAALGAVMTAQGIGASLSNALGGMLIGWIGWRFAFLGLAAPPLLAIGLAASLLRTALPAAEEDGVGPRMTPRP